MKNRMPVLICLFLLVSGCAQYLPIRKDIPAYPYGSFTKIKLKDGKRMKGELLTVSGDTIYILDKEGYGTVTQAHKQNIKKLRLELAINSNKPVQYQVIPKIVASASYAQGLYAVYTFIPNVIIAAITHPNKVVAGHQWVDLYKYSRYPQGIPSDVNLNHISSAPLSFRAKDFPNEPVNRTLTYKASDSVIMNIDHPNVSICIYEVGATDGDVLTIKIGDQILGEKIELDKNPICKSLTLIPQEQLPVTIKTIFGGENPQDIIKIIIEDGKLKRTTYLETKTGLTKVLYLHLKP